MGEYKPMIQIRLTEGIRGWYRPADLRFLSDELAILVRNYPSTGQVRELVVRTEERADGAPVWRILGPTDLESVGPGL